MIPLTPPSATFHSFAQLGTQFDASSDQGCDTQAEPVQDPSPLRPASVLFQSSPILSSLLRSVPPPVPSTSLPDAAGLGFFGSSPNTFRYNRKLHCTVQYTDQEKARSPDEHSMPAPAALADDDQRSTADRHPNAHISDTRKQAGMRIRGLLSRRVTS